MKTSSKMGVVVTAVIVVGAFILARIAEIEQLLSLWEKILNLRYNSDLPYYAFFGLAFFISAIVTTLFLDKVNAIKVIPESLVIKYGQGICLVGIIVSSIMLFVHKESVWTDQLKIGIMVDASCQINSTYIKQLADVRLAELHNNSPIATTTFQYTVHEFPGPDELKKRIENLLDDGLRQFIIVSQMNLSVDRSLLEFLASKRELSCIFVTPSTATNLHRNIFWLAPDIRAKSSVILQEFAEDPRDTLIIVRSNETFGTLTSDQIVRLNSSFPRTSLTTVTTDGPGTIQWSLLPQTGNILTIGSKDWIRHVLPELVQQRPHSRIYYVNSGYATLYGNTFDSSSHELKYAAPIFHSAYLNSDEIGLTGSVLHALELIRFGWKEVSVNSQVYDMEQFIKYFVYENPRPIFENGLVVSVYGDMKIVPRYGVY